MARKVTSPALAVALAASLALTSVAATPARAGSEDTIGAIAAVSFFALLTAGLIASSASQARDDAHALPPAPHDPHYVPPGFRPGYSAWSPPRRDPRKILPAQCGFIVSHGRDAGRYYDSACLRREFSYWPYLPDRCEEHIDIPGPDRRGYDVQCLAHYGYTQNNRPRSALR